MSRKDKKQALYYCRDCGVESLRWAGRCAACGAWNTIAEAPIVNQTLDTGGSQGRASSTSRSSMPEMLSLEQIEPGREIRSSTGMAQLDVVLGGGIAAGAFILIAGEPGVGKSTLLLEIARNFPGRFFYFSGEESPVQIKLRAERMGVGHANLFISRETDLDRICNSIVRERPDIAVIDSVQTMRIAGMDSTAGSPGVLRGAAMALMDVAKSSEVPILITGHITKDGAIAGPRLMEHMTDVVLYFESDRLGHYRLLRSVKNRFGATGEVAIYEMNEGGLNEPLSMGAGEARCVQSLGPGRVYSAMTEGSRAIAVEVQALVNRTPFGQTRRMAEGLDNRRLILLAAALEKHLKVKLSEYDIFANLAGGLSSDEPALDLAICASVLSSYTERALEADAAYIGEVGLSGEIRASPRLQQRVKELTNQGFKKLYVPQASVAELQMARNISVYGLNELKDLNRDIMIDKDGRK